MSVSSQSTPAPEPGSINTPLTSVIGSIALAAAGVAAGWLSSHNIIPANDVPQDTALICTLIVGVVGGAIIWFKARMATASAHIAAVNSSAVPGVKVVPASSLSRQVDAPIPPTDSISAPILR